MEGIIYVIAMGFSLGLIAIPIVRLILYLVQKEILVDR